MEMNRAIYTLGGAFDPRQTPADLIAVYVWTACTIGVIYLPLLNASPLRVVIALPMVLFIPGYCLVAALFPEAGEIDGIERLALSFGLSIAVVPLIGLALNYTPMGIRLDPIVASLVVFTIVMAVISQIRRHLVPPDRRFQVPVQAIVQVLGEEFHERSGTRWDRVLSLLLLAALITAMATTVYAITVPKEGEKFSEFYILGEGGKAAGYPAVLATGEPAAVIIGIGNHEYRNVTYFIEIFAVNQSIDPLTRIPEVQSMTLLDRYPMYLAHNTTTQQERKIKVNSTGYNQIMFLLFRDEIPPPEISGSSRVNASYRDLHLWVTVRSLLQ